MIKFVLILQICSVVQMDCMPEINQNPLFNTHSACVNAGHLRSLKLLDEVGEQLVNRAKIQVRIKCEAVSES